MSGCTWNISGWVDVSIGWGISVEHYDVTMSSSCGDKHHFVGAVGSGPTGGLTIQGNFYQLSPVNVAENTSNVTIINTVETPVQDIASSSVSSNFDVMSESVQVSTADGVSASVESAQSINALAVEDLSGNSILILGEKSEMPEEFPFLIKAVKTNLNY